MTNITRHFDILRVNKFIELAHDFFSAELIRSLESKREKNHGKSSREEESPGENQSRQEARSEEEDRR